MTDEELIEAWKNGELVVGEVDYDTRNRLMVALDQLDELRRTLPLLPGDIVQITESRKGLIGAFVLVEEVKTWGVQGFIHHVASFNESKRTYLRLSNNEFERVGRAVLLPKDFDANPE